MARGWRLTKVAWDLIRRDPTMIAIALIGTGFGLAGGAATMYYGGGAAGRRVNASGRSSTDRPVKRRMR